MLYFTIHTLWHYLHLTSAAARYTEAGLATSMSRTETFASGHFNSSELRAASARFSLRHPRHTWILESCRNKRKASAKPMPLNNTKNNYIICQKTDYVPCCLSESISTGRSNCISGWAGDCSSIKVASTTKTPRRVFTNWTRNQLEQNKLQVFDTSTPPSCTRSYVLGHIFRDFRGQ